MNSGRKCYKKETTEKKSVVNPDVQLAAQRAVFSLEQPALQSADIQKREKNKKNRMKNL